MKTQSLIRHDLSVLCILQRISDWSWIDR